MNQDELNPHASVPKLAPFADPLLASTDAANFDNVNQCTCTVWAATLPGGGCWLDPGQEWILAFAPGITTAQIWGRTNCSFCANGQGQCDTGDCNGLLGCQGWGSPPNTLAEFSSKHFNMDFQDISLVDGFNLPMHLRPTTGVCRGIKYKYSDDIDSQCPAKLKAPGGCNNPCTVFKTNEYCCTNGPGSCGSTTYSQFFKDRCPDAYTCPLDDPATFTCPGGTNYKVTFCP